MATFSGGSWGLTRNITRWHRYDQRDIPYQADAQQPQWVCPTNGSDCGSLRDHNLTLLVRRLACVSTCWRGSPRPGLPGSLASTTAARQRTLRQAHDRRAGSPLQSASTRTCRAAHGCRLNGSLYRAKASRARSSAHSHLDRENNWGQSNISYKRK